MFSHVPEFVARKLFRSFETSDAFLEEVAEIRRKHAHKKIIFLIFDAGLLELLALRYFFAKKWGDGFVLKRALGFPQVLVNSFRETWHRFLAALGFSRFNYSIARLCKRELDEHRPILFNLPIGFRAGKITTQEKILEYLIQTEENIILVPAVFIWRRVGRKMEMKDEDLSARLIRTIKSPILVPWYLFLGDPSKPLGLRKLFMMLRGYSRSIVRAVTVIEVTKATTLQSLRRESIRAIQREKRAALGPIYKPSRGMWEQILRDPEFLAFIHKVSMEEGISEARLLKRSQNNLKEIASDFSFTTIEIAGWVLEKVFHTIYQGITFDREQLKKIRETSKDGVIVFIPNHRSYLDFLILSYFLFREQMIPPHVAAGINMNFWPAGSVFKGAGAFFIRRSFRGDKVYAEVLRRYVLTLINNKINLEFFIEGMRSRCGKMTPPKYGILKMIVDGFLQGKVSEKIYLVPLSITYDRVTEDKAHKRELEGGGKINENFFHALQGSFKILFNRYGRVHLRFGDPFKLDDAVNMFRSDQAPKDDFSRWVVPRIAFEVCHRMNRQTPVTAAGLVSTVLIARPGAALSRAELEKWLLIIEKDLNLLGYSREPELEENYLIVCNRALNRLIGEKIIQEYSMQDEGMGLKIVDSERMTALYYRNTAIHAFLLPALWGMAHKSPERALELRSLLRFEFFFQGREDFLASLKELPENMPFDFYAYLIEDLIENIYWSLGYLNSHQDFKLDEKEWASRLLKFGQEKILEGEIRRRESVNTNSVKGFIEMAKHEGWLVNDGTKQFTVKVNENLDAKRRLAKEFLGGLSEWDNVKSKWLKEKIIEQSL